MTPEQLQAPRYKAIAPYPHTIFTDNSVIQLVFIRGEWIYEYNDDKYYSQKSMFDAYPHLFKKLLWYEQRKQEDLPQYVYNTWSRHYFKVTKWEMEYGNWKGRFYGDSGIGLSIDKLEPATQEQYETYKKTEKGKQ